jgi:hypothetical protein
LKVKQETKNMLLELCIEIDVQIVFSASWTVCTCSVLLILYMVSSSMHQYGSVIAFIMYMKFGNKSFTANGHWIWPLNPCYTSSERIHQPYIQWLLSQPSVYLHRSDHQRIESHRKSTCAVYSKQR